MLNDSKIAAYTAILQEELLLATGCTEPIAVAYCAAKLREVLGGKPEEVLAEVSGNILKNVKSVVVPNTDGRRGIDAAIAVGIVAGDADAELQVIANVTEDDAAAIQGYLDATPIKVTCPVTPCLLDIFCTASGRDTPPRYGWPTTTPTSSTWKGTEKSCWKSPSPPMRRTICRTRVFST